MRWCFSILFAGLVTLSGTNCYGQSINLITGFDGFFDNREYYNEYAQPQTIFGVRLSSMARITFNQYFEIGAGANILYEFGDKLRNDNIKPIIYFHFDKEFINFYLGTFPRRDLIQLPLFLQSDTIFYYRPNCDGIFLEYKKPWGHHSLWLDWTSRQKDSTREIFQIGGSGGVQKGLFLYQHDFIMSHYSLSEAHMPAEHIRDNGGLYMSLGINLSSHLFDSLIFKTGYCFSYDRLRSVYDFKFYNGCLSQFYIELFPFGIRTSFYFGEGQVQLWGDKLYQAKYYNRTDFIWYIFNRKNLHGAVEFSFHVIENVLDVSQSFKIYALVDDIGKKERIQ
jgi:hypothetical protein